MRVIQMQLLAAGLARSKALSIAWRRINIFQSFLESDVSRTKRLYLMLAVLLLFLPRSFAQVPSKHLPAYQELLRLNNTAQYQSAIRQAKHLVEREPLFSAPYEELAIAFEKAGRINDGLLYLDSLRRRDPNNAYVYHALGSLENARNKPEQAIDYLKKSISLDRQYTPAYLQLVTVCEARKDLEAPTDYFQLLLKEDAKNAAAYYGLGSIHNLKKEWEKATAALSQALEINPQLIHAYYLKGLAHVNRRDLQAAQATWDKGRHAAAAASDIKLQSIMTGNLGNVHHDMGLLSKAIPLLEEALNLARKLSDKKLEERHLSNLGNCYERTGRRREALKLFDEGLAIAQQLKDREFQEKLLHNKSAALVGMGEYTKAVEVASAALRMAEARADNRAVASHCRNIGSAYANLANYPLALKVFNRALSTMTELDDKQGICSLLMNIGNIYKEMGDTSKAIDSYNRMLDLARQIGSKPLEQSALGALGYAYGGMGEYSKSNDYLTQALAIADALGDAIGRGTYLGNIGVIYKKWGNYPAALGKMREALAIAQRSDDRRGEIRHYVNMANIFEMQGDYLRALDYEKNALAISERIGTKNYTATVFSNMGVFYDKVGDHDEALKHFQLARKIYAELGYKEGSIHNLNNIGALYINSGDYGSAEKVLMEAVDLARTIQDREDEGTALTAIGDLHLQRKDYRKALSYYVQALTLSRKIGHKSMEGTLRLHIGKLNLKTQNFDLALSNFKRALEIGKRMDAFTLTYESLGGIASVEEKQTRYDEAIQHYLQAIERIESVRERLRIEGYKSKFMEGRISIYEDLITLLIRLGKFEEAYDSLQRFRARSFLEILAPDRIDITEGISRRLWERYRNHEQQLREAYEMLVFENNKTETARNQQLIAQLEARIENTRNEHERTLNDIRVSHPRWSELTGNAKPMSMRDIQGKVLSGGVTLLEYFSGAEVVAAWVIRSNSFHCEVLNTKRERLENQVRQLRQPFTDVKEGKVKNLADVDFDLKLAQQLYEEIFQPLERHIPQGSQLLIVPDGILHYLPFEALVTGIESHRPDASVTFARYENASYLLQKYPIAYAPASAVLAYSRPAGGSERGRDNRLLAFGRPDFGPRTEMATGGKDSTLISMSVKSSKGLIFAPLSDRDAREVSQIMQPATLIVGKDATEDRFKREAGAYANIYLSTHAIVDENRPLYSLIAFAYDNASKEDGFLHTYEVFNLRLNADLVTLSACETGLGKLSRGEGVIGLTRAFIYAGAPSVIVSLWSVDQSTAILMKEFYRNLKSGDTKAEALRQAKIKLLGTRVQGMSFAHPFLWAPFVLVGRN